MLRIFVLSCQLFMNPQVFADLVVSSAFDKLPEDTQWFIFSTIFGLGKTVSIGEVVALDGATQEIMSREAPATMHMTPRSPRPK